MRTSALDHFTGRLGDAHLPPVVQHAEPDLGRLLAARIDQLQVGQVDRRFLLADTTRLAHATRLHMPRYHRHTLHHGAVGLRQHAQHLAAAPFVNAGDHHHRIALADARSHHKTSGASDMILVNLRARNSRTTGPKIRVPIGSSCLLISTAALRSKRIALPSPRRTGKAVRTMTAWWTSPFFTLPRGIASLMETTMISPTDAVLRFDPPSTLLH